MNKGFELIEIKVGGRASIYTIRVDGEDKTELDKFLSNAQVQTQNEALEFIVNRLYKTIPEESAQERFFDLNEGKTTDSVVKLKHSNLRCYCLRFGKLLVIAGNGGVKPPGTKKRQDKKELNEAVILLQYVEQRIKKAMDKDKFEFYDNGRISERSLTKFEAL